MLLFFSFECVISVLPGLPPLPQIRIAHNAVSLASASPPSEGCIEPITEIHPWQIVAMKARRDGMLEPLEYTLKLRKAHRLSIIDIDAKDMSMGMYVDGVAKGDTPVKEVNKTETCNDANDCWGKDYSSGSVVVPRGKHTVRVQWAGFGELPYYHHRYELKFRKSNRETGARRESRLGPRARASTYLEEGLMREVIISSFRLRLTNAVFNWLFRSSSLLTILY